MLEVFKKVLIYLFWIFLFLCLLAGGFIYGVFKSYSAGLPDINEIKNFRPSQATKIYSSDGKLIDTLYMENRTYVPLSEVSDYFKKASLSNKH